MPTLLRAPIRQYRTAVADSRRWDGFTPRDGDIVIATWSKCGTTWMQRIVDLLVFQSPEVRPFGDMSPWLDSTLFSPITDDLATLAAQTHRRFIKSHLPFDSLPVWEGVKYIHVGRDGRDATLSWHNHRRGASPAMIGRIVAEAAAMARAGHPPLGAPPHPLTDDPRDLFLRWLDDLEAPANGPGAPPDFFDFEATYWRERTRPNLIFAHYDDLKQDLAGEMRRLSGFLEIETPESLLPRLVEAAGFSAMKADGDALFPGLKAMFDRGADRFINQGRSGRWREILHPEDVARYEAVARRSAPPALAAWLATGRRGAGDPRDAPD